MLTLFLIAGAVVCTALYRSITSLLRQIPNGNRDFNAFLSESGSDNAPAEVTNASQHRRHLNQYSK
ncbi:MAG: hypothetical protein ACXWJK_18290 [Burkholderiaceae bacterium]